MILVSGCRHVNARTLASRPPSRPGCPVEADEFPVPTDDSLFGEKNSLFGAANSLFRKEPTGLQRAGIAA
jgi:hypothetical protein